MLKSFVYAAKAAFLLLLVEVAQPASAHDDDEHESELPPLILGVLEFPKTGA